MFPAISLAAMAMSMVVAQAARNTTTPHAYPPVDFATGDDAQSDFPRISLVSNPAEWQQTWQFYLSGDTIGNGTIRPAIAPPPVDFDKNCVVAVFSGLHSLAGYRVAESFVANNKLHLRLEPVPTPNLGGTVTMKVDSYAFVIYKKQKDPIDVEFPVRDRQGAITWQLAAELSPTR